MHRRPLASAAAVALLLGLTACSDEPAPPPPPSISNQMPSDGGGDEAAPSDGSSDNGGDEAEPTTEEDAILAPEPADFPGMDEHTPEGAEQAARYLVAHLLWGFQTGDTTTLKTLYTDSCSGCFQNVQTIEAMSTTNNLWAPVTYADSEIYSEENVYPEEIVVSYDVRIHAHSLDSRSPQRQSFDRDQLASFRIGFVWEGNGWTATGMNQDSWEADE